MDSEERNCRCRSCRRGGALGALMTRFEKRVGKIEIDMRIVDAQKNEER